MAAEIPTGNWNYPNSIIAGPGRIAELAAACGSLGIAAPLLVTDSGVASLPIVQRVLAQCRQAELATGLFAAIRSNPSDHNVSDGVVAFHAGRHDGVIAFGGGSALDAGKAIALMVGQTGTLWDFEDCGDNWTRVNVAGMAPLVAVPTTAGTGSEVGRAAVITDQDQQCKRIIFHPAMLPGRVILDPELTIGLPAALTAATGMDALAHNLEALCSPAYHPMADGIAMEGIRLVGQFLPRAVANGRDIEARMQMLAASAMGATAFQKGLGAMHALAHPLGALYDAHHGLLNAILMPFVLQANRTAIAEPLTRASHYMGLDDPGFDGFLAWVLELRRGIGIPDRLTEIGIDDRQRDRVGQMATLDSCAAGNPVRFTAGQYGDIFGRAVAGAL